MLSAYGSLGRRCRDDGVTMLSCCFGKPVEDLLGRVELPCLLRFPHGFVTETELAAEITADLRSTGRPAIEPQRPSQLDVLPARPVDDHLFGGRRESDGVIAPISHWTFRRGRGSAYP